MKERAERMRRFAHNLIRHLAAEEFFVFSPVAL